MTGFNLDQFIEDIMGSLEQRNRVVISRRFGLQNGQKATLQEIGNSFGITRERVRQIENKIIKNISSQIKNKAHQILNLAINHLEQVGGIRREKEFLKDLAYFLNGEEIKYFEPKIKFIFEIAQTPYYYDEDENFYSFWYLNEEKKKEIFRFVNQFVNFLKAQDKAAVLEEKIYLEKLKNLYPIHSHFLMVSKKISINNFGDIGLNEWPEINPRAIRDKIYLVLKKRGQPMHFRDIAKDINLLGISQKPAHIPTVHNELIKDERFVLVGRGLYGLKEHGFEPGTVKDIIVKILKDKKSLKASEIVKEVEKKKFVKKSTILINLQNKKYFKRSPEGFYSLVLKKPAVSQKA